ncbi:MAG: hypothetical protein ACTSR8_13575 [Promethearchaeota archaeon]
MVYNLDQTFNTYLAPNNYEEARTKIYYDISFEYSGDWRTSCIYKAKFYRDNCEDLFREEYDFEYIFSNSSREIYLVINSYFSESLIEEKHPIFYSTTNPGAFEPFLLDEMMLIRGSNGFIEKTMTYNGTKTIHIDNIDYLTFEFIIDKTLTENYIR